MFCFVYFFFLQFVFNSYSDQVGSLRSEFMCDFGFRVERERGRESPTCLTHTPHYKFCLLAFFTKLQIALTRFLFFFFCFSCPSIRPLTYDEIYNCN
uniref:Secreted protein n=1 Tax=Octopus bimaculoides TaxID=37653 RepID=A0A0L8IAT8_OCTBM